MAKYEKYADYQDSGVEWIGEIPSHWITCSLSKLFSIKAGGDVDLRNFSEDQSNEYLYPIYTNANDAKSVYGYSKVPNYQANSITVSGRGEVGFAVYRDHAFDAIIRLLVLSPQKECEPKFFAYFINEVINFRVESSAIGQLSTLQISPYKIVLPSLSEQKSVVDYLDHETTKIDSLIGKQEKLIELLKEKRQAVISHAVTKGLNPDVNMKDSGVEWLGQVPEHWIVCRLKHVKSAESNSFVDGPFGSNLKSEHFIDNGDVYVIESNFATTGILKPHKLKTISYVHFETIARSECKEDDIIIAKIGARYGSSAILPKLDKKSVVSGNSLKLTIDITKCHIEYAHLLLQHLKNEGAMDDGVNGSAQPALSLGGLNNIGFLVPPMGEQNEILKYIFKQISIFDGLIKKAESAIELMKERRTALISSAVTGKIDLRNWQHPNKNNEAKTEFGA